MDHLAGVSQQSGMFSEATVQTEARVCETQCERGSIQGLLEGGGSTACGGLHERTVGERVFVNRAGFQGKEENR
jgi:hypothetical protein